MNYRVLIHDFAKRTLDNMEIINAREPKGRWEVTQLINSLYGIIIAPKETALRFIPKDDFAKMRADNWPPFSVRVIHGTCTNLRELIIALRHGAAHAHITFADKDGDGHTDEITITNKHEWRRNNQVHKVHIVVVFSATALWEFVIKFGTLLQKPNLFPKNYRKMSRA